MGVTIFTQEFTTPIAPPRMSKALIVDSHNLIPKIAPQENLVYKYILIKGNVIFDKIEKVIYEVQFLALGNCGCICKMTNEYHTKGDVQLNEEDIKQRKEEAMGLYKVVEEFLLANPNAYD
ncbi:pathogenesis-related protein STH-21 [Eucalyptus grandis]|uniref:pathogenesis-related protein STH-21 n=1 Tax=Eucalyptus grandis TaxID=71139 RepID=UPI00192EDD55|nr:pathogenesis-related protein STH-21 [Eucalyptus grandis]